ncbi:hypothetical protein BpHYR1_000908, partial [Brachionus plicatilis]
SEKIPGHQIDIKSAGHITGKTLIFNRKTRNYALGINDLLFADDLGNLENKISKYLKELEKWLCKWKIKLSLEKSCLMRYMGINSRVKKILTQN